MRITLKGYCPTQKKIYEVEARLLDGRDKLVGRIECEYSKPPRECFLSPCPIVRENGYHH